MRAGLGIIDVGTLGKLQVSGPDAVEVLERLYTGRFKKLSMGRCRYGVALDESGVVIEDGVIARLGEDRFYATTTSSGAAAFYREMLRWAAIWGLDVTLSNVTGQLSGVQFAGPESRDALAALTDIDLRSGPFSYLRVREGEVAGVRAIVMRVGFVGELGYEIHVPAWEGGACVAGAGGGRCAALWGGGAAPVALGKRALDRRPRHGCADVSPRGGVGVGHWQEQALSSSASAACESTPHVQFGARSSACGGPLILPASCPRSAT